MKNCQCVFPTPSEEELITVPGGEPNTAWRLFVDASAEGYVRVQQLHFGDGIGWYVQKSMVLPREVVAALVPQLRKALCLMPPTKKTPAEQPVPFLRITGGQDDDRPLERLGS